MGPAPFYIVCDVWDVIIIINHYHYFETLKYKVYVFF